MAGINPKDLIGQKKANFALISPTASFVIAKCMENGAGKYGPYNWRNPEKKIGLVAYVAATLRHVYSFLDGEDLATDSGYHHLGHAAATLQIMLDAIINDYAVDDRPPKGNLGRLIEDDFQKNKK